MESGGRRDARALPEDSKIFPGEPRGLDFQGKVGIINGILFR
jgi:hypothetical protein